MDSLLRWALIFGLPVVIVAILYKLLEQRRYLTELDAKYPGVKIKVAGPAALYIVLVFLSLRVFPQPSYLTIRLFPSADVRERLLKDNDVRVYLRAQDVEQEYSDFGEFKDHLEETQSVVSQLWNEEIAIRIAPTDKYALETSRVVCQSPFLDVSVLSPSGTPRVSPAGTEGVGPSAIEWLSATPVPLRTDLPMISANLNSNAPMKLSTSKPALVSLGGQHLGFNDRLSIVDVDGKAVPKAWVGDSVGAANGRPAVVSKDGGLLKAYVGLPAGTSEASYFLRVDKADGATAQAPITATQPQN